jgi:hypothetical protein
VALSYSIVDRGAYGDLNVRVVDITLDNSYPSGGWAVAAKDLGFGTNGTVYGVMPMGDAGGYSIRWNPATGKLTARDSSGAANAATPEITTVTLLNGVVVRVMAMGKGHG